MSKAESIEEATIKHFDNLFAVNGRVAFLLAQLHSSEPV
jgi:hypothetical protein